MRRAMSTVGVMALLATADVVHGQPPQPRRIVGTGLTGHLEMQSAVQTIVEFATLTFPGTGGADAFTVDFVGRYRGVRPESPPEVVDIVITQLAADDERPEMTMQLDGQTLPLVPRLRSRRSLVVSIPFADFAKLSNAETIVERAFDTELEFGTIQMKMLRSVAQRWAAR